MPKLFAAAEPLLKGRLILILFIFPENILLLPEQYGLVKVHFFNTLDKLVFSSNPFSFVLQKCIWQLGHRIPEVLRLLLIFLTNLIIWI